MQKIRGVPTRKLSGGTMALQDDRSLQKVKPMWSPKEIWISESGKIMGRSGGFGGKIWEFVDGEWKEIKQHPLYYEPY